jgi:hypothetical protein
MAKLILPAAHTAIPLAITLTLFAQLLLVETSFPQVPTPGLITAMVVAMRLDSDASRPKLDTLWKRWRGKGKESRNGHGKRKLSHEHLLRFVTRSERGQS